MEYNFEKICRICLNEDVKMMSLFKVNVSRKIMSCSSIQVWPNDKLPTQICLKCCAKLHVAYQFKKQCEKSDSKLRTYLVNKKNKMKDKEKQQNEIKNQEIQRQLENNSLGLQQSNNCLYVECTDDLLDPNFIEQQNPLGTISNFNLSQNNIQTNVQIGNYNVQNVIYNSTTYPVTSQPMQVNSLINNQVPSLQTNQQLQPIPQSKHIPTENKTANVQTNTNKIKNEEETTNNQCPICLKQFLNSSKKNRHMKIHTKTDMPYKCNVCNKEFMHGGNYKIHMRMHNNERPFCCSVCPKRFVQAQDLEKHTRTHTGERPHKCPMCWKAFSTGSNLIAHVRTHTGERPYVCSICSKAFCQSNELTKHTRTHTGEKSHICDICHKGFNGSSTLIVHRRSHTGEKPFVCKICDKSFTQSGCLTSHLKRYGESKYSCEICNNSFHSEKVLQEHQKTKEHNENVYQNQNCVKIQSEFNEFPN